MGNRIGRPRVAVLEGAILDADISLAALGLAAQIAGTESGLDLEQIQSRYPDIDILSLADELVSSGIFVLDDPKTVRSPPIAPGYIYVAVAGDDIKIGVTRNVPARLKSLQTGCPDRLRLAFSEFVSNCVFVEQEAHRALAACRRHGEWFRCSEERAIRAVTEAIKKSGGSGE